MRPRVWLPPADDDERHRQLDLLIYGETLSQALETGRGKFLQAIGGLRCVQELVDSGMDILRAEQHVEHQRCRAQEKVSRRRTL